MGQNGNFKLPLWIKYNRLLMPCKQGKNELPRRAPNKARPGKHHCATSYVRSCLFNALLAWNSRPAKCQCCASTGVVVVYFLIFLVFSSQSFWLKVKNSSSLTAISDINLSKSAFFQFFQKIVAEMIKKTVFKRRKGGKIFLSKRHC